MGYDHESREKLAVEFQEKWNRKLEGVSEEVKALAEYMEQEDVGRNGKIRPPEEAFQFMAEEGMLPSRMMEEHYGELVGLYVPEEKREEYYQFTDKMNRSGNTVSDRLQKIFQFLFAYKVLDFYGGNLAAYLRKELPEELLDFQAHTNLYHTGCLSDLVAAAIDAQDAEVIRTIEAMLGGKRKTAGEGGEEESGTSMADPFAEAERPVEIDRNAVWGVVKSSDSSMYELLGRYLLSAGIQDGIREMICRAANRGTIEAFIFLFGCICERHLYRFGSVRLILMEWLDVWDSKGLDMLMKQYGKQMQEALRDRERALEFCRSSDRILIYIGLWGLERRDRNGAMEVLREFSGKGTKDQLMVMAYFNTCQWTRSTCRVMADRVLCAGKDALDLELTAAYWDAGCLTLKEYRKYAWKRREDGSFFYPEVSHPEEFCRYFFQSVEDAAEKTEFLLCLLQKMPAKEVKYEPCVFPWHSAKITVSGVLKQLCFLAHMRNDRELTDYVLEHIGEIKKSTNMGSRGDYVELLLNYPSEKKQADMLVALLADKESDTRKAAAELLDGCELEDSHYKTMEGYLRLKNGEIRRYVIGFLRNQREERIPGTVERLLASGDGKMREGALDLILEVVKEKTSGIRLTEELRRLASQVKNPKENEKILLQQIMEEAEEEEPEQEGFGLYRKGVELVFPKMKADRRSVEAYFAIGRSDVDSMLKKLAAMIEENADCIYPVRDGEAIRLDDYLNHAHRETYDGEYPFRELWERFYEEEIKEDRKLGLLVLCMACPLGGRKTEEQERFNRQMRGLLGETVAVYMLPAKLRPREGALRKALNVLSGIYGTGDLGKAGMELFRCMLEEIPAEEIWYEKERYGWKSLLDVSPMYRIRRALEERADAETFAERFWLYARMDETYRFHESRGREYRERCGNEDLLDVEAYVKACALGLIGEEIVFRNIFEKWGLQYALEKLGYFERTEDAVRKKFVKKALWGESEEEGLEFLEAGDRIYTRLTDRILEDELKRGEMPTVFSEYIGGISCIYGMDYFVEILKALGDGKLDRNGGRKGGKRECLSHLLAVCMPKEGEDGMRLKELVKDEKGRTVIADRRLVEAGMYAPQWLGILEEYFGMEGFQSGCYYFIAHMSEWFGERRKAMIARYTPLPAEELRAGAFDCKWFGQVYETLGEKRFGWLYDAAKYISDGSKHVRARKYADAALGRVTAEELEAEIAVKRNKDLLMSYGLVPFRDKRDILRRYEFLQRFLKEGRNFGSMRRTSEVDAVKMALRNMASAAGYADTMRLTLAMEGETVKEYGKYMEWHETDGVRIRIETDGQGVPSVVCEKDGKRLKSVPAKMKKEKWTVSLLAVYKKLREQNRRCIRMFEQAMKERERFCYGELLELSQNPIAAPILKGLVFIPAESGTGGAGRKSGYFSENGLLDAEGNRIAAEPDTVLRAAHPVELFREGTLEAYQRGCYALIDAGTVKKQPFKQVFREFYIRLEEELDQKQSHAFAGYQVEPSKALACLKSQGWMADAEEGIQKICYGENIIAGIRVLSDWITAEDLMTPSIDWIDFYDRKNHEPMYIRDVPEVVYSEIMRDADLAVSVAYAGGVDPETCRSAMEMRKVIAEYNLPLFGIGNVEFVKNHAVIHGKRADYTVHMGSGVVHRKGGPQIYIKAVPAQRRGRIFLPFVDEDPKTAEILSKIILFARDEKIRDPEILKQIGR